MVKQKIKTRKEIFFSTILKDKIKNLNLEKEVNTQRNSQEIVD